MFTCTAVKIKTFKFGKLGHILNLYIKMVLACKHTPQFSEVKAFFGVGQGWILAWADKAAVPIGHDSESSLPQTRGRAIT